MKKIILTSIAMLVLTSIFSFTSVSQNNSLEMNFSHAYDEREEKSLYLGVVWDAKTGENRIFYTRDIENYDFKGSAKWKIAQSQLAPIVDGIGEIKFKALACLAPSKEFVYERKEKNRFLAFNTNNGKALLFEYSGGKNAFKVIDKSLSESKYKSPKGGEIMWDIHYTYEIGGKPKYHYTRWNTRTGKNSLKDFESSLIIDPTVDGKFMISFAVGTKGDKDYVMYTTKSLKAYSKKLGWIDLKGRLGKSPANVNYKVLLDLIKKKPEDASNSKPGTRAMMIFEKKSSANTIGVLGDSDQCFYRLSDLSLPSKLYSDLKSTNGEIGVCQLANAEDRKIEYLIWNKNTGKFKLLSYTLGGIKNFKTMLTVNENLLLKKAGVPAKMIK